MICKNCKYCQKEFQSKFKKDFCSIRCANLYIGFQKNKIISLIKNYKSFDEIPLNIIKELWKYDSYEVSKSLKTYGFFELNEKYRAFKKTHKLCENCNEFYETRSNKGLKLCPKKECKIFNLARMNESNTKASLTKLKKYNDPNYNNRTKFTETYNSKTPEQIKEWGVNRSKSWAAKTSNEINEIVKKRETTCEEKFGISNILKDLKIRENYFAKNGYYIGQSPESKAKRTKTEIEKYGGSHNSVQICKDKVKETNLKKYGFVRPTQNPSIKNKVKETTIKKYGVENVSQNPKIRSKIENTSMQKYGTKNPAQSPIIKARNYVNYKEKYGVEFAPQKHLQNLKDYNDKEFWIENFCVVKNGILYVDFDKIYDHFGILAHSTIYSKMKDFNLKFRKISTCNTAETKFLDSLESEFGLKLIRQYKIQNFKVDGFNPLTNTIYEFLGDYWHGNLEIFEPLDINENVKKTFYELNSETFCRFEKLTKLGYKVCYIWESDFCEFGIAKILTFQKLSVN